MGNGMPKAAEFDPLAQLETLAAQIPAARDRQRLGDALDNAVQAVTDAEAVIARLERLAELAPVVGAFLDPTDRERCRRLLTTIRGTGTHLCAARDQATLEEAARQASLLPGHVSQTEALLQRGWRDKVEGAFAATGALGAVLREIPETCELGSEMEALSQRAERLASSADDPERCAQQFSALTAERDSAREKLGRLGAGDDVVAFMLAVAGHSATLGHVTAEVREWLDAHNARNRFKVGL
jgi:hypothetical protein